MAIVSGLPGSSTVQFPNRRPTGSGSPALRAVGRSWMTRRHWGVTGARCAGAQSRHRESAQTGGGVGGDFDTEDRDLPVGRPKQAADAGEAARSARGPPDQRGRSRGLST